jgi:hypothetical protein
LSPAASTRNPVARSGGAGAILSLGALAIAAIATIVVFFGIGFSLLMHSARNDRAPLLAAAVMRVPSPAPAQPAEVEGHRPTSPGATPVLAPEAAKRPPATLFGPLPAPMAAMPEPAPTPAAPKPVGNGAAASASAAPPPALDSANPAREGAAAAPPAPAAPARAPSAATTGAAEPAKTLLLTAAELNTLLTQGDAAFRDGDLTSARLYYLRAFGAGDGRGALGIGASYDPVYLRRYHLWTQHPVLAEAREWYVRAQNLGSTDATSRLDRLTAKLRRGAR